MLSSAELSAGLNTEKIGKRIIHFTETDSTNTQALLLARGGAAEGTVVLAERQTAGRGRMDRTWHSPPGAGIYLSVILTPRVSPSRLPGITLVAAVAGAESLKESTRVSVDIKWPNDLLLNGRKICGILTELHSREDGSPIVIVGIGINVNTPRDMFPEDIANTASSIMIETGREASRKDIVSSLLGHFERWYRIYTEGGFAVILDRWKAYSGIIGRRIRVEQEGARTEGTVLDIDISGALIIHDDAGLRHSICSGDIVYV